MSNIRIGLVSLLAVAILAYIAILIRGGGFRMDGFTGVGQPQNTFTLYYMNGCPHCESILPAYKTFAAKGQFEANGKKTKIRMVEQGEPSAAAEMEPLGIKGFPSFFMKTSDGNTVEYNGERTVSAISTFITQHAT
jgi:thiol-disulfide isomerase/thioredoxin